MYYSLHNHTHFSNCRGRDSIITIPQLLDTAFQLGLKGVAITDHECLSGHIQALRYWESNYRDSKDPEKQKFKLILGNEIYLTSLTKDNYSEEKENSGFFHFLVLANNENGYKLVKELSAIAWRDNYFRTKLAERVPVSFEQFKEVVKKYPAGSITATSACVGGLIGARVLEYCHDPRKKTINQEKIRKFIAWCKDVVGEKHFFLELHPADTDEQIFYNNELVNIAAATQTPLIVATDSHYTAKTEQFVHRAYLKADNTSREVDSFYSLTYLMNEEEILEVFTKNNSAIGGNVLQQALHNTTLIGDAVTPFSLAHPQVVAKTKEVPAIEELPQLMAEVDKKYEYIHHMAEGEEYDKFFVTLVLRGLLNKGFEYNDLYLSRIDEECEQVYKISQNLHQSLANYYLTIRTIVELLWTDGDSLVGPARGSAAGFFCCYLLDITQVNPLQWDMPSFRHIHHSRPELADVDIDSQQTKRPQILQALKNYFGADNVLNIITFGTEKSKSALLSACRGLGYDVDIGQYLSSLVPVERGFQRPLHDCLFGNKEKDLKPVHTLVNELKKYPDIQKVALAIEGLINKRSVHASGVYIYNEGFLQLCGCMRSPSGQLVTCWDMEDSDYAGSLKYDLLTVENLDRIRVTMNLLLEDGLLEWQGSLKATYDKYLHPDVLDYDSPDMWDMIGKGEVISLFQFSTSIGQSAGMKIRPKNVIQMATANSVMRLMADDVNPLDKYQSFTANIDNWYEEMRLAGLTKAEQELLEKHLLKFNGMGATQEDVMRLCMDKDIAGFDMKESNKIRKVIAKKKMEEIQDIKAFFFQKGKDLGTSHNLLTYLWDKQFSLQMGYSFSYLHSLSYSLIGLQNLNLCYHYPPIYWNTACLVVDGGAIDVSDYDDEIELDDEVKEKATNYGKIAVAIGNIKARGVNVSLPDINKSQYSFKPDAANNLILYGLKGLNKISDSAIATIIAGRPYDSLGDFIKKTHFNKTQMVSLIKAGCFEQFGDRLTIMREYIESVADKKKRITLQNMNGLIEHGLFPSDLNFYLRLYKFHKFLKANKSGSYYLLSTDAAIAFFSEHFNLDDTTIVEGVPAVAQLFWDKKIYDKQMDKVRAWMKANQQEILDSLNSLLFKEMWDKYCEGSLATWEMESLNFYFSFHELTTYDFSKEEDLIDCFQDEPEYPRVEVYFSPYNKPGLQIPLYYTYNIIGTVIDKDKTRHTVTILTARGEVVDVKFNSGQFSWYDKQISVLNEETGKKTIVERSWFKRGNHIKVRGFRRENTFIAKIYKKQEKLGLHSVSLITGTDSKGFPLYQLERATGIDEEDADE